MIGKINGIIEDITDDTILINVNNISYIVYCTSKAISTLTIGQEINIFTTTAIKDDIQILDENEIKNTHSVSARVVYLRRKAVVWVCVGERATVCGSVCVCECVCA